MSEIRPSTTKLISAFAAVYLIWGSTYLAIRYAIVTIPPLLMASARFLIGGILLYAWARSRGAPVPTRSGWRGGFLLGGIFLVFGNGGVALAEQWVPSGLTALLIASTPLWIAVLGWLVPGGRRPTPQISLGIILGLIGVASLIGIGKLRGAGTVDPVGASILMVSSMAWSAGTLVARKTHISDSPLLSSAMQMIGGGTLLMVAAIVSGQIFDFKPGALSGRSVLALGYLAIFGSIVGFTAYSWLLKWTTPSRAATYAYVNPIVAVILGWAIAGEPVTSRMMVSMAVIVAAVMVITTAKASPA